MPLDAEIIVAGSGPAGTVAATILAQNKFDVLLIDKHQFPRDKSCGDEVAPSALEVLHTLGLKEIINESNFHPIHAAKITAPNGASLTFGIQSQQSDIAPLIAPRKVFDKLLFDAAIDAGSRFMRAKVLGPEICIKGVCGVNVESDQGFKTLKSRLVIAADGSFSVLSRHMNPGFINDRFRSVAIRGYTPQFKSLSNTIEIFTGSDYWPGYAWIFPTGSSSANIGLGSRLDRHRSSGDVLKKQLDRFIHRPEIKERFTGDLTLNEIKGAPLALGSNRSVRRAFDGLLLVGDAACLVNPMSGGGIANGILSSKMAADIAIKALKDNNLTVGRLRQYDKSVEKLMRREFRIGQFFQDWLYRSTDIMNWGITRLPRSSLFQSVIRRSYPDLSFKLQE